MKEMLLVALTNHLSIQKILNQQPCKAPINLTEKQLNLIKDLVIFKEEEEEQANKTQIFLKLILIVNLQLKS